MSTAGKVEWMLALILGGMFIYTGWVKLAGNGPQLFLEDVRSFHLLGDPWAAWLAISLPILELVAGAAVLTGLARRGGTLLLTLLLLAFLAALVSAWVRGIDIKCGCFGKSEHTAVIWELILRDVALLGLAWGIWGCRKQGCVSARKLKLP
jgi:uncharacterized membrane protein YphA (DoxX/SURF4 family)